MTDTSGDQPDHGSYSQASPFVHLLKTPSRVKILDVFLGKHYEELTTQEIAELADIDRSTVTRNLEVLEETNIIEQSGKVGNAPQYRLNTESEIAKALGQAQARLISQSEAIADSITTGEVPFDPEDIQIKDHETDPKNLREKVSPMPEKQ